MSSATRAGSEVTEAIRTLVPTSRRRAAEMLMAAHVAGVALVHALPEGSSHEEVSAIGYALAGEIFDLTNRLLKLYPEFDVEPDELLPLLREAGAHDERLIAFMERR